MFGLPVCVNGHVLFVCVLITVFCLCVWIIMFGLSVCVNGHVLFVCVLIIVFACVCGSSCSVSLCVLMVMFCLYVC